MFKAFNKIAYYHKKLIKNIIEQAKDSEAQIIPFGMFGVIAYPAFYVINLHLLVSQSLLSLCLRIVASLLCFFLIIKNYWPNKLRSYFPFYWYFTIWYVLPFFISFNLFENHASVAWLMNLLAIMILMMLLVNWLTYAVLLTTGIFFGWLTYNLFNSQPFYFQQGTISIMDIVTTYGISIVMGIIFSRNKALLEKGKIQAMQSLGASIAHELRTPLQTINLSAIGIKKYFPIFLTAYEKAKENNLTVPDIDPLHYESLLTVCDDIKSEAEAAFITINMLLIKANELHVNQKDFEICKIDTCIEEALRRYPFNAGEKELIHLNNYNNFIFKGNKLLVVHIFFNLLKNSLYSIQSIHKGEIFIWTEKNTKENTLHFKDTGKGISVKFLPYIFDRFITNTPHGTGIGLSFCKVVMENIGGRITCHSKENEYAEFILHFPLSMNN